MYRIHSKLPFMVLLSFLPLCSAPALHGQESAGTAGNIRAELVALQVLPEFPAGKPMKLAVKTNLLFGALALAPNLGFEVALAPRATLDLGGGVNAWNLNGSDADNRKLAHWLIHGEYRHWFCERFNGSFIGGHAMFVNYNIAGREMPMFFGKGSRNYRYEGYMVGAGISYGYHLMLGRKWNAEFTIGAGYGYMRYDQYGCKHCDSKVYDDKQRNYFGPTSAGISLVYLIK